jgi:cytochrome c-type biogenesis protein CcmH
MIFWVAAAGLTILACLAVLWPFSRRRGERAADAAFDLEVYKDQLKELDGELQRGLISADDFEQARAEIGRKVVQANARVAENTGSTRQGGLSRSAAAIATVAVLAVPAMSWATYAWLGKPGMPSAPLAARLEKPPGQASPHELIAQAEKHLAANPQDGRGWEVLAPIYMDMQRFDDAATAFRNSIRLNGSTVARQNGLGEALTIMAEGVVTAEAEAAFRQAQALDKADPVARFYLATAKGQQGKKDEAVADLQALLASAPADAPWRATVEAAIGGLKGAPAATAQSGPSAADVEAAADMKEGDRMQMIEGMVAQLSERLKTNPDDMAGWQRLIRSYTVLGKSAEAKDALNRAIAAFGADEGKRTAIVDFAKSLNVEAGAGG